MPAFAGSSWYFLRYMDSQNTEEFVGQKAQEYWQNVDLYIGGTEHAVGHLLYSRFWHKFFKDNNWVSTEEPFKKLVNQGMIQGRSLLTKADSIQGVPAGVHIPIMLCSPGDKIYEDKLLQLIKTDNRFENVNPETDVNWETSDRKRFISLHPEVEKMSKSKFNVVNPDDMISQYGADTFRMFEMFLGPIEAHKPWDINGIEGVSKFIRKVWRLYNIDENGQAHFAETASKEELKILHKTIKKAEEDIERFSFNTVVSGLMIAVNEWSKLKEISRDTLEILPILMSPFAPFISEVLWSKMGKSGSVTDATFPTYDERYLKEDTVNYPVSFNGKVRFQLEIDSTFDKKQVEEYVMVQERTHRYLQDKAPKKIIVVPGRIVNIVV